MVGSPGTFMDSLSVTGNPSSRAGLATRPPFVGAPRLGARIGAGNNDRLQGRVVSLDPREMQLHQLLRRDDVLVQRGEHAVGGCKAVQLAGDHAHVQAMLSRVKRLAQLRFAGWAQTLVEHVERVAPVVHEVDRTAVIRHGQAK